MSKKILKIAGGIGGLALGGLPGAFLGAAAGSVLGKSKHHDPQGFGEPLPVGTINPDGSQIPVDKKRRRLYPAPSNTILSPVATTPPPAAASGTSTTLGG